MSNMIATVNTPVMIPAPDFYTTFEGGKWISWQAGDIRPELKTLNPFYILTAELNEVMNTYVNGILVHSLCWKIPADTDSSCFCRARWDCINGWTKPLKPEDYKGVNT